MYQSEGRECAKEILTNTPRKTVDFTNSVIKELIHGFSVDEQHEIYYQIRECLINHMRLRVDDLQQKLEVDTKQVAHEKHLLESIMK
jgi:hypothetical protein